MLRYVIRKDWFWSSLINQLHVMFHPGGHEVPSGVCPMLRGFLWDVLGHGQVSGLREDEFSVFHPKTGLGPCRAQQFLAGTSSAPPAKPHQLCCAWNTLSLSRAKRSRKAALT